MYATRTAQPRVDHAAAHLVRAARTAPSLHNSQPWLFTSRETGLDLFADPTRRLLLTDPDGREQVISCGAALFNVRLAMRNLGFVPVVRPFPDPWHPARLARIDWGAYAGPGRDEQAMHHAMGLRRTHRGPFQSPPLAQPLIDELREQARAEGAELYTVESRPDQERLAELVREAEDVHRTAPGRVAELVRWTRPSGGDRRDGVPFDACPYHPDSVLLAGRDFLGLTRSMPRPPFVWPARTGLVAVLTTQRDTRRDWLRAGQALQRVLLYATAHRAAAAFHTQPLELPHLRAQIRTTVACGRFPQVILRLGHATRGRPVPRRPVPDVLSAGE